MKSLTVIVSGNAGLYREFFNAIVITLGDSAYQTLIRMTLLLAGMYSLMGVISRRNYFLHFKWILCTIILSHILFANKVNLKIVDLQSPGTPVKVDNVPLGLGILASYSTRIGNGLTSLLEKNFSMPNYQTYLSTGMVFASRMIVQANTFRIQDASFRENMDHFIQQCIFNDISLNRYSPNDLFKAVDIWDFIKTNTSKAVTFLYDRKITTCTQGAKLLDKAWPNIVEQADSYYAKRLFPKDKLAKSEFAKRLPLSYNFLSNLSMSASNIMQQQLMANAVQDSLSNLQISYNIKNPLSQYAYVKASLARRNMYMTLGRLAADWLPLMRNAFEAILFASFIFIFLLSLFPFGLGILKNYIVSLFWLQMWAPLYAIVNLIASFYAQTHSGVILENGLLLQNKAQLFTLNDNMIAVAGYLSMSVPFLAAGLLKGMVGTFVQMAQYLGGSMQHLAANASNEVTSGNLSLGNTQYENHYAMNTAANHFDSNSSFHAGGMSMQTQTGADFHINPNHNPTLNEHASDIGITMKVSDRLVETNQESALQEHTASIESKRSAEHELTAALGTITEADITQSHERDDNSHYEQNRTAMHSKGIHDVHSAISAFQKDFHVNDKVAKKLLSAGVMDLKVQVESNSKDTFLGKEIAALTSLSAKVTGAISHMTSHSHEKEHSSEALQNTIHHWIKDNKFVDKLDSLSQEVAGDQVQLKDSHLNTLLQSTQTHLNNADKFQEEASSHYQHSQQYQARAEFLKQHAKEIDSSLNNRAFQDLLNQDSPYGEGKMSVSDIDRLVNEDPEQLNKMVNEIELNASAQQYETFKRSNNINQAAVSESHKENDQSIKGEKNIYQQHASHVNHLDEAAKTIDFGKTHDDHIINNATRSVVANEKKMQTIAESYGAADQILKKPNLAETK